jgi:hypothetical protein
MKISKNIFLKKNCFVTENEASFGIFESILLAK